MAEYTIRQMAERFDVTASTLRYYEEIGILGLVEKNEAGQRKYSQEHVERMECIQCFKKAGMTLTQLQRFFQYEEKEEMHIDEILKLLLEQQRQVEKQLEQLLQAQEQIRRKVVYYKDVKTAFVEKREKPQWEAYRG